MIAKITTGNYTKGLISYHENKVRAGEALVFHSSLFMADQLSAKNIELIFNSLTSESKRKDKNFHVSLNFTKEDFSKIDKGQTKNLINDYLKEIGFPEDHPFISYKHIDKKHPHIHIICPKILETGKALNDSNIFIRSRKISRSLEEKYGLSNAEDQKKGVVKTAGNLNYAELKTDYDNKNISLKEYLSEAVNHYISINKPSDIEALQKGLSDINIYMYSTEHKTPGLIYTTKQNTPNLQAKDTGIKASSLSKNLTYKELESTFESNKHERKESAKVISKKIDYLFFKYYKLDINTFKKELKKQDIDLLINQSNNVIRGLAFNYKGLKFKGQDLPGRNYTMGKISHKFSDKSIYSEPFVIGSILHKNKLKEHNTMPLKEFTDKAIKSGILPYFSPYGIRLSLIKKEETQPDSPEFFVTSYNDSISKLSQNQINSLNSKILSEITSLEEKTKIPSFPDFTNLSFFDDLFDSASMGGGIPGDDDQEFIRKKKRKK